MDGLEREFAGTLQVVRLNFDRPQNRAALRALRVRGHPTIVLIDRQGIPQESLIGQQTDDQLRPRVEALVQP